MKLIKHSFSFLILLLLTQFLSAKNSIGTKFFSADNPNIQYTGRVDFSNPKLPKFWSPGVYVQAKFKGNSCKVIVHDEVLYGNNHNYIEVVVDNQKPYRIQTKGKIDTINVSKDLDNGAHIITICKNTESNIGYLQLAGIVCEELLPLPAKPKHKIEYIGDSITCGTGSDLSVIDCGKGQWYDQHNAYMSYGPTSARLLNAQWSLTAVSGIGLIHSCCNMSLVMPPAFDKVSLRQDSIKWNFSKYQPDVVTVCLGQNDGVQDSVKFTDAYIKFIKTIRNHYPKASIVCLTSPMGDFKLTKALKNYLTAVVKSVNQAGDKNVSKYFFSKSFNGGCDYHPNMAEHQIIAMEVAGYIKKLKNW
ncbi:MAG: acetyl xylan esterase [Sphingobacteriaceae bacterium]|nr:MAG: acetyl xylan esterase [Sphingobacteriaceae bacterium]